MDGTANIVLFIKGHGVQFTFLACALGIMKVTGTLRSLSKPRTFPIAETRKNLQVHGLRTWKVQGLVKAAEGTEATFIIPNAWLRVNMLGKFNCNFKILK